MDLKSGTPFWPIKDGLLATYPSLKHDLSRDLVLGRPNPDAALFRFDR